MTTPIVTTKWLAAHLSDPNLIILDATPASNVSGLKSEYDDLRIVGARHIDIKKDFSDKSSPYPNMLPDIAEFEKAARTLGINNASNIVVYDSLGIYTSPRVWWLFQTMGHQNIAVLDGGLPAWIADGFSTEKVTIKPITKGDFKANLQIEKVKDIEFVKANANSEMPNHLVIDARSAGRFAGTAPEPRAGLRSGSIPQSVNLPFQAVLENGKLKPKEELTELFAETGVGEQPLVFSCGSGLTACILLLASELVLENEKAVYDGSWTEWAQVC